METVHIVQNSLPSVEPDMDRLSLLIGRHAFNARVFFNGSFCDTNQFVKNGSSGHLHLVRSGPVEFINDDGSVIQADPPALVFYPRGASHRLQIAAGESALLLCADIFFEGGLTNSLVRVLPDCLHLPLSESSGFGATIQLLFNEAASRAPGREVILDRLCDVLLIQVIRREFDSGRLSMDLLSGLADRQLPLALAAIHDRPAEPWTVQSLADIAGMSRSAFTEHFRVVMGLPPGEYLTRWRITLGGRLLRQGLPVKQVSSRIGYTSSSTFTRAFTTQMGASPREWLKQAE
jgi:AraC-like DNA-binding protein